MIKASSLPQIIIAQSAVGLIKQESLRYHNRYVPKHDQETGGIMIGKRLAGDRIIIVAATKPGPNAEHYQFEFGLDADHANAELQRWIARDPEVDFIGVWHKHPPSLDRPSPGDRQSAYKLFADPDYANVELVNPIVVIRGEEPLIRCFYMSREDVQQERDFRFVQYQQLPDSDPIFRESARMQALASVPRPLTWHRRDPERFTRECNHLEGRYQYEVSDLDGQTVFKISLDQELQTTIYLITAPQYPEAQPELQIEHMGQELRIAPSTLNHWSRRRYVVDIVAEVERMVERMVEQPKPRPKPAGSIQRTIVLASLSLLFFCVIVVAALNRQSAAHPAANGLAPSPILQLTPNPTASNTLARADLQQMYPLKLRLEELIKEEDVTRFQNSVVRRGCSSCNIAIQGPELFVPVTITGFGSGLDKSNSATEEILALVPPNSEPYRIHAVDGSGRPLSGESVVKIEPNKFYRLIIENEEQ